MAGHYSIWLMPPPGVRDRVATVIDRLSRQLGTPRFEPHITLSGARELDEVQARAATEALAVELAPVPVHLADLGEADEYFRCLYLKAEPNPALLAAHRRACAALGRAPAANYLPHMSLVYGDLSPSVKQAIIAAIGARIDMAFVAPSISLCLPAGPPAAWRTLGPFALTGA